MGTGTVYTQEITSGRSRAALVPAAQGLSVLFLPKHSRTDYFQSFLAAACAREGWRVEVVCSVPARRLWRGVVAIDGFANDDKYHLLPDFNERQDWEDDAQRLAALDDLIGECERAAGI